jgi:hypothetical protein
MQVMYSDYEETKGVKLYRELAFSFHALKAAQKALDEAQVRHNNARMDYYSEFKTIPDQFLFTR